MPGSVDVHGNSIQPPANIVYIVNNNATNSFECLILVSMSFNIVADISATIIGNIFHERCLIKIRLYYFCYSSSLLLKR